MAEKERYPQFPTRFFLPTIKTEWIFDLKEYSKIDYIHQHNLLSC